MHVVHDLLTRDLDWPSAQQVYAELKLLGVRDPAHCLNLAPRNRIFVERRGDPTGPVVLRVRGLADLDVHAGALDGALCGFVPVLRRCVDELLSSAGRPRACAGPVLVRANEWFLTSYWEKLMPADIMIAGLLLQAEELVGLTRLPEGADGIWGAELYVRLLEFISVGTITDYLAVLDELEARSERRRSAG